MTESTLRIATAGLFVVSHFLTLVLVGALYLKRGFTFEETTTTIAIIAPLFAGYTTLIVKHIIANRNRKSDPSTSPIQSGLFVFCLAFHSGCFYLCNCVNGAGARLQCGDKRFRAIQNSSRHR